MIVGPLPLADVDRVWTEIAGWMHEACRRGRGSMTAWEIYQGCRCGSMLLFLAWLDDEIKADPVLDPHCAGGAGTLCRRNGWPRDEALAAGAL